MLPAFHASHVPLYDLEDLTQALVWFSKGIQRSFAKQSVAISCPAAKRAAISSRRGQDDPARSTQVADE